MTPVPYVLSAFVQVLAWILEAYFWIIIARAVVSWVNADRFNPIVVFLYRATEPVLRPIRRRLPTNELGLDLSPMVVLLAIKFFEWSVIAYLRDLAFSLR